MIIHGVFIYSLSVVFDSASYIKTFGLTEVDLSQSIIYKVAIFAVLVAIASGGEKLLFKISGPMVVVKVGIILIFGFAMIPHWNLDNIPPSRRIGFFATYCSLSHLLFLRSSFRC